MIHNLKYYLLIKIENFMMTKKIHKMFKILRQEKRQKNF